MGLSIARQIAALHMGTMLLERREGSGLFAAVSLPTGPLDVRVSVQEPRVECDGGLSPVMVELSDVLPHTLFQMEDE